jgi:hypothetical protein
MPIGQRFIQTLIDFRQLNIVASTTVTLGCACKNAGLAFNIMLTEPPHYSRNCFWVIAEPLVSEAVDLNDVIISHLNGIERGGFIVFSTQEEQIGFAFTVTCGITTDTDALS